MMDIAYQFNAKIELPEKSRDQESQEQQLSPKKKEFQNFLKTEKSKFSFNNRKNLYSCAKASAIKLENAEKYQFEKGKLF